MEVIGLLHSEVYMPENVVKTNNKIQKVITNVTYSNHFTNQCVNIGDYKHYLDKNKVTNIILGLKNNPIKPFEVEISKINNLKVITKICIRTTYDESRDISIVIIPRLNKDKKSFTAFIKTAWLNSNADIHYTLDKSKYLTKF